MLTRYQCQTVAYATKQGELICLDCAEKRSGGEDAPTTDIHGLFLHLYGVLDPEVTGLEPVVRYSLDEDQVARGEGRDCNVSGDGWADGECECLPSIDCEDCGAELVEAYNDPTHEDADNDPNPPAVRWVPCGECHAGDGERHAEGCSHIPGDISGAGAGKGEDGRFDRGRFEAAVAGS